MYDSLVLILAISHWPLRLPSSRYPGLPSSRYPGRTSQGGLLLLVGPLADFAVASGFKDDLIQSLWSKYYNWVSWAEMPLNVRSILPNKVVWCLSKHPNY